MTFLEESLSGTIDLSQIAGCELSTVVNHNLFWWDLNIQKDMDRPISVQVLWLVTPVLFKRLFRDGRFPLFHSMGMHEHTDVKARLPLELHHHSA